MRLPLLDIRAFRTDPQRFAEELRHACHHAGFFQLRHGLPVSLVERVVSEAREFFARSDEEKQAVDYSQSSAFRGYMRVGVENTAGKTDLREQVEIAAEGAPAATGAWPAYLRLRGPNQWPEQQPGLEAAVAEYTAGMREVSSEVTRALCMALGLEPTALDHHFEPDPHWQLKLAAYQPAEASGAVGATAEPEIGVGAHTDSGWLTMLLQDESGGLQAFTQGSWTDVPPLGPECVVVNLGEVAEMLSGGYLLATPHRVLLPAARRLSVPYFYNPRLEATVAPLPAADIARLPWERDDGYDAQAHWRRPSNAMIHEYGANAFKSLARSHPAVFERHHPDLHLLPDERVLRREDVIVGADGRAWSLVE